MDRPTKKFSQKLISDNFPVSLLKNLWAEPALFSFIHQLNIRLGFLMETISAFLPMVAAFRFSISIALNSDKIFKFRFWDEWLESGICDLDVENRTST